MLKLILTLILTVHVLKVVQGEGIEDLFQIVDGILSSLTPIGLPDNPLVEDGEKLKRLCEILNADYLTKIKDRNADQHKGVAGKIAKCALDKFSTDKITICQVIKKEGTEKGSLIAKEYNKHSGEANKLRLSFLTAVHELTQKGTKASLPTLSCYLKQFSDKLVTIFPDKDGAKDFVKSIADHLFKEMFIATLEAETGKAVDSCPLPEATTNPSKLNSVFVITFTSILALQDK